METCIYRVIYDYRSRSSFAFDNPNAVTYVEARKGISAKELEQLLWKKKEFDGLYFVRKIEPLHIHKLA